MKSSFPGIKRLLKLESTTSTQDFARGLAKEGAKEGTLVWALRQTSGRGRMERRWHSAGGGLYFSLILKPPFPPSKLADFSLLTAEAAAEAISDLTDLRMEVKPPNDVVTRDSEGVLRKVCGILAEASGGATSL
ncbi:MAG: biotin--[acetyl-CoA-carboxylase] ligase, partial [Elusimicrobia bacterium]|nr:biotin--[acetyl-CoA-carboxylase] ligase [Elusimicrobiota bacterium]